MSTSSPPSSNLSVQRVSTVELFFDLVFVFAITQLTDLVAHPIDPSDYLKCILVFMTLMWIYSGYAWLTSNLAIEHPAHRHLLFAAMAGFFVMALSIPDVFGANGLPYALGLLTVTAIHSYLFTTAPSSNARAVIRIAAFNFTAALFVLAAAFVIPPWDWPLWLAAVAVLLLVPAMRGEREFQLSPAHFVERNGLLVIVALGESVVAIGLGAEGLPVNLTLVLAAVLALFLSAGMWWSYFDKDARRAEHQFAAATPEERARMGVLGFGLAHFVMIFGIILIAAGLEVSIAHPTGPPDIAGLWNLATGLAVYLLGGTMYRYVLRIGSGHVRLVLAALGLVTVPLGLILGAVAQVAVCVLLVQSLWLMERNESTRAS